MLAKSFVVLGLLAAVSETVVAVDKGEGHARHMGHLQRARMLKKRTPLPAPSVEEAVNPCKRETSANTKGSLAAGTNFQVIDASGNLNLTASGNGRAPLRAGYSASSSTTRQSLQVDSWTPSSSSSDTSSSSSDTSSSSSSSSSWSEDTGSSSSTWEDSSSAAWPASSSGTAPIQSGAGVASGMQVVESWTGNDFKQWDYFTYSDPTHGNVNYVSLDKAEQENLISIDDGKFKISVSTGSLIGGNRDSVRISSPKNWKKGQLAVASFSHMPDGCGTWPAYWSIGAQRDWPAGGEIDILEGVNGVPGNTYTLHTTTGCNVPKVEDQSGLFLTSDCQYQPGCSIKDRDGSSFGPGFNKAGGGVYASYYDDDGIKIWFWPASDAPDSIKNGSPDMSTFGQAKAVFKSDTCNVDQFFDDEQMLIINTTLMGDWAGATFWQNGCSGTLEGTLADASNFNNAYWLIDYVKLYSA